MLASRFIRRLAVLLALSACVWLLHASVLRGLARLLVVDESRRGLPYICLSGNEYGPRGDRSYDEAADRCRKDSARVLLIEPWPRRLSETGVVADFEAASRRELLERGLDSAAIESMPGRARDPWEEACLLGQWLHERPGIEVGLACDRFDSRCLRFVMDAALDPEDAARVRVLALVHRNYDETDWWTSRQGIKAFMFCWLELAYTWARGEDREPPQPWTTREYRQMLDQLYGEVPQ